MVDPDSALYRSKTIFSPAAYSKNFYGTPRATIQKNEFYANEGEYGMIFIDPKIISHSPDKKFVSEKFANIVDSSVYDIIAIAKFLEKVYPDARPCDILDLMMTATHYGGVQAQNDLSRLDPSKSVNVFDADMKKIVKNELKTIENGRNSAFKGEVIRFTGHENSIYSSIGNSEFFGHLEANI